ncbi:MAG: sodium:solute symporter family protein [Chitinispirillaceae bacterium]|nr:sodium:solute symporter family protein [Chitinispirillaceae bacterium]
MSAATLQILIVLAAYTIGVMLLGFISYRKQATITDFLMANREFNYFVLFAAVFGANISAVTLVGVPGLSYHIGWVTWAYFVTTWAWLSPLLYYTIGNRAYVLGKRYDVTTISELLGKRWESKGLQALSASFLLFYLIPYMMVGIIGGGRTFAGLTHGFIPYWVGCLLVTLIVGAYVLLGGMRGAAWVNTFQTAVFLIGGLAIFLVIAYSLGGFGAATSAVVDKYPELMNRSKIPWQKFFSYGIICALAVPVFPNVFSRLLTGKSSKELKKIILIYPFAGLFLFVLMAYSGMWGHTVFPALKGAESDQILGMLLAKFAPAWMAGVLGAAIFSALMSTLDSQLLAIGQILMKDYILPNRKEKTANKSDTTRTRLVLLAFAIIAFVVALYKPAGIIKVVEWAFGGFASMLFPVIAALYWKRCSKGAIFASILVSQFLNISLPLGLIPAAKLGGFLPAFWSIVGGLVILLIAAAITPAPDKQKTDEFFLSFAEK